MNFKDDNNTAVKNNTLSLDQVAFLKFPAEYLKLSVRLKNFFFVKFV